MDPALAFLFFGVPTIVGVVGLVAMKLHERSSPQESSTQLQSAGVDGLVLERAVTFGRTGPLKRAFDLMTSSIFLLMMLPLVTLVAIIIRLDGGPVLVTRRRLGVSGEPFHVFKFRTTRIDANFKSAAPFARDSSARHERQNAFASGGDPRITPIGGFLRRTDIDEIPMLINVLRGEMTFSLAMWRSNTPGPTREGSVAGAASEETATAERHHESRFMSRLLVPSV